MSVLMRRLVGPFCKTYPRSTHLIPLASFSTHSSSSSHNHPQNISLRSSSFLSSSSANSANGGLGFQNKHSHAVLPNVPQRSLATGAEADALVNYMLDFRAVAATAALVGLGYRFYRDKLQDMKQDRNLFVNMVINRLDRDYKPPGMAIEKLGFLRRAKARALEEIIYRTDPPCSVTLLEGPSRSGKSTVIQQLLKGRKAVVYFSFKERKMSPVYFAKEFGGIFVMEEKAFGSKMEDLLDVTKDALTFIRRTKGGPPTLVVLDDIQKEVNDKDECFNEFADIFVSWLLEMKNLQLINILMITNEANTLYDILLKSGFSSIDVRHTGRLPRDVLTDALVTSEFTTLDEAKYIVNSVGPHMGHIEDVLRNMAYGHTGTIKNVVQDIIEAEAARMIDCFVNPPPKVEPEIWFSICFVVFSMLTVSKNQRVEITNLIQQTEFPVQASITTVKALQSRNMLYWRDSNTVTWHIPVQNAAAPLALKSPIVSLLFNQISPKIPEVVRLYISQFNHDSIRIVPDGGDLPAS